MPQVFGPRANGLFIFVLIGVVLAGVLAAVAGTIVLRADWNRATFFAVAQPVPFSHEHHVGQLGLDCRYCHTGVETSASAGLPATEVCMTCHSQLFTDQAMLRPVRQSLATGMPIVWNRVNDLPDYVYFNHAVHVNNGVGCETCHGRLDRMPLTWRAKPLTMEWCLSCHRDPGPNLRPKSAEFAMGWTPPVGEDPRARGAALINLMHIDTRTMTDCYVCHR
jgi:hypothetical protein